MYEATANRLMQHLDQPTRGRVTALDSAAAAGRDPILADMEAAFVPLRHHSTTVGVTHHRDRIHVCWDGALVSVGVAQIQMTVGEEQTPWRELEEDLSRELLDGYRPVVVTTLRHANLTFRPVNVA